jgi:fructokinase
MSTALITGEVLYDIFENGNQVLGGAPFNVAWHLQGFGLSPLFISAVGHDENGDNIRNAMQTWGMSTRGLQTDSQHPTGTVQIHFKDGTHSFKIRENVAYDFINSPVLDDGLQDCKLMYHGSLALRSSVSRQTITSLRQQTKLPVFVDVNLRAPFWEVSQIREIINGANWVKLNDEELVLLSNNHAQDLVSAAQGFREEQNVDVMIVTRGEQGAFLVTQNQVVSVKAAPVEHMIDTVGAGDGFSAMAIAGLIQGWGYKEILESASLFAAKICGIRGAIHTDRIFYDDFMDEIH